MRVSVPGAVAGVVLCVPMAVTFLDNVGYPAPIEGHSMRPTLNPRQQRASWRSRDVVWVNVWSVRWGGGVGRGDVVILHSPTHPGEVLVKRVIGEEGETIETKGYRTRKIVVPSGHCWVEGDNLRASRDSNLFGPVSRGLIFGRGTHVVWPPQRWRRLNSDLLPQQRARVSHLQSYSI